MLFFLKSAVSFLLFLFKSLSLKPLFSWANEVRLLLDLFWRELLGLSVLGDSLLKSPPIMSVKKKSPLKVENVEESGELLILDLPDLVLECILGKLSPGGLCSMAAVSRSLRERCRSDHLWERHMREKWGRVFGPAAYRDWQLFTALRGRNSGVLDGGKSKGLIGYLSCMWPISWLRSKFDWERKPKSSLPVDSKMAWYLALESGKFWFPAQVYNREKGHVGFMLSCYDAKLKYDSCADIFHARYPPHGRRTSVTEEGVQWERIRAPPIDTLAHDLHASDCLNELCPSDHIEIQWRRNKEFPYGWWYGVVGHLESCDGNEHLCKCHESDTVILEFNHYNNGSRWRRTAINRKDHREEGNESDGFYGGIRKLQSEKEIAMWKKLWPKEILD